jgi:hypothetical protein
MGKSRMTRAQEDAHKQLAIETEREQRRKTYEREHHPCKGCWCLKWADDQHPVCLVPRCIRGVR